MKQTAALAALLALSAAPALAHGSAHLHPHGAGNWLAIALAALAAGGLAFAWWRR